MANPPNSSPGSVLRPTEYLLVRNLLLGLQSHISPWASSKTLSKSKSFFFGTWYFTVSCHVELRPFPDRRELHCNHPHPRSGCRRKGKFRPSRSVSVVSSTEIDVFYYSGPLGAPMGMAPVTHVLFTRSVYRRCIRALRFVERFG